MASHPNYEKTPARRYYDSPEAITKLLGGETREGSKRAIGDRRRMRMNKRMVEILAAREAERKPKK